MKTLYNSWNALSDRVSMGEVFCFNIVLERQALLGLT